MDSSAEVVIRTTSPDVKVDAMCVTPTGDVLCVGSKMGGRVWHGEIHRACQSPNNRANQPLTPTAFPSPPRPDSADAIVPLPSPVVPADARDALATARAGLNSVAILADGTVVAGSDAGTIEAWSLMPGNLHPRMFRIAGGGSHAHDAAVTALATCGGGGGGPRGQILVSAGGDGAIVAWERLDDDTNLNNLGGGEWRPVSKARHAHLGPVHGLAASADGSMLASVGEDGYVRVWSAPVGGNSVGNDDDDDASPNIKTPTLMTPLAERAGEDVRAGLGRAFCVEWCESVGAIAVGFESGDVAFLETDGIHPETAGDDDGGSATLRTRGVVHAHADAVRGLAFHPASRRLASCGDDGFVCVHVGELPATTRWRPHGGEYARCVVWGEDGSALRSGGWDGTVRSVEP